MKLKGLHCKIKGNSKYKSIYIIVSQNKDIVTVHCENDYIDFNYKSIDVVETSEDRLWHLGKRLSLFKIPDSIEGLIMNDVDMKKYIDSFIDKVPFIKKSLIKKALWRYLLN